MPFDQFTIEQIAGDMLPERDARPADRHRLPSQHDDQRRRRHRPEESLYEVLVDRVNTTATVWLGTHASAARSATTTSTTRSARRTTTGCSRSSSRRPIRAARPATARATAKRRSISRRPIRNSAAPRCRPAHQSARSDAESAHDTGARRGADHWETSLRNAAARLDAAHAVARRGHRRRHADAAGRRVVLASGPNADADDLHDRPADTALTNDHGRPPRSAARRAPAERRPRPRPYGHFRSPASRSTSRQRRPRAGAGTRSP